MDGTSGPATKLVDMYRKSVEAALARAECTPPVSSGENPDANGSQKVTEAIASITQRMVRQAGGVADEASALLDEHHLSRAWTVPIVKLTDIVVLASIEMAETVFLTMDERDTKTET